MKNLPNLSCFPQWWQKLAPENTVLLQAPQIMIDRWNENVCTHLLKISFIWHGCSYYALWFKWYLFVSKMKLTNQNLFDAEQFDLLHRNFIRCRAILFAAEKLYLMQSNFICCRETHLTQCHIIRRRWTLFDAE